MTDLIINYHNDGKEKYASHEVRFSDCVTSINIDIGMGADYNEAFDEYKSNVWKVLVEIKELYELLEYEPEVFTVVKVDCMGNPLKT